MKPEKSNALPEIHKLPHSEIGEGKIISDVQADKRCHLAHQNEIIMRRALYRASIRLNAIFEEAVSRLQDIDADRLQSEAYENQNRAKPTAAIIEA